MAALCSSILRMANVYLAGLPGSDYEMAPTTLNTTVSHNVNDATADQQTAELMAAGKESKSE